MEACASGPSVSMQSLWALHPLPNSATVPHLGRASPMNFFSRKNLLGETQTVTCRIERDPTSGSFGLSLNDHNRITKVAKGSPCAL